MKNTLFVATICGILMWSCAVSAMAMADQGGDQHVEKQPDMRKMHRPEGLPGPLPGILKKLDLSDEQWQAAQQLLEEQRTENEKLHVEMKKLHGRLRLALNPKKFDEKSLQKLSAKMQKLQSSLMISRARTHSRIYALLTPEQQELADLALKMHQLAGPPSATGPRGSRGPGGLRPACPAPESRS